MEDTIFEYIGYIIAFLFFVLPRIIKWFAKKNTDAQRTAKPQRPVPKPVIVLDESMDDFPGAAVENEDEKISSDEFKDLIRRAENSLGRAEDILTLSKVRRGAAAKMSDAMESTCVIPLRSVSENLASREKSGDLPEWDEAQHFRSKLDGLERLTEVFDLLIQKRISPDTADLLGRLDTLAQECLVPFLTHAQVLNLQYPTRITAVVFGTPGEDLARLLSAATIAPVIVDDTARTEPSSWVNIASDVALDVFHSTRGLARQISADLKLLPPPMSLNHYTDKRSFTAGLLGGWMPRIFADSCAALLLGPGYAAGLAMLRRSGISTDNPLETTVGDHLSAALPPLHVRMFAACRVLQHLGLEDEARRRFKEWSDKIEVGQTFLIRGMDGRVGALPVSQLLQAVSQTVDYLMQKQLGPLGGFALTGIPSLGLRANQLDKMREVSATFLRGEPVDVSGRTILAAAQLAVEKSGALASAVSKAALRSMGGEGKSVEARRPESIAEQSLTAHVRSPMLVMQAMATAAALAPRTARFSRRRLPF